MVTRSNDRSASERNDPSSAHTARGGFVRPRVFRSMMASNSGVISHAVTSHPLAASLTATLPEPAQASSARGRSLPERKAINACARRDSRYACA